MAPLRERFDRNVFPDPNSGCFIWAGEESKTGYGRFALSQGVRAGKRFRVTARAHRVAWELQNGPIPQGLVVMHTCDCRLCVNPDHLRLGTQAENLYDMARKGRSCKSKRGLPRGVYRSHAKGEGWSARIHAQGKNHYLGTFPTIEEAAVVAAAARKEHFNEA